MLRRPDIPKKHEKMDMKCYEVLFEELPDQRRSVYDAFVVADWIDQPLVPPCMSQSVPRKQRKPRRTQRNILDEIRSGFAVGRFDTKQDQDGATYADFYLFVDDFSVIDQRWIRVYEDGSVMYENKHYPNPWNLLRCFGTSRQSWLRQIYQKNRSMDWHLRKQIKC